MQMQHARNGKDGKEWHWLQTHWNYSSDVLYLIWIEYLFTVLFCRYLTPKPRGLNSRNVKRMIYTSQEILLVQWHSQRWMTDGTPMPSPLSYHYLILSVAITSEGNKSLVPGNYYWHGSSMNNTSHFTRRPIYGAAATRPGLMKGNV